MVATLLPEVIRAASPKEVTAAKRQTILEKAPRYAGRVTPDEWLALCDGEGTAHAKEVRRIPLASGELGSGDLLASLVLRTDERVVRVWYVGWSRDGGWLGPRIVRRAGIWVRERDGAALEESWDVRQRVVDAVRRSAERFAQLEKGRSASPAHLDVHAEGRLLASGVPRGVSGGIARTLVDDALGHARKPGCPGPGGRPPGYVAAVAHLEAWAREELLGHGTPCDACATSARTEMSLALGGDSFSDARDLALVACGACRRRVLVLREESRRGAGEAVREREIEAGAARATIVRALRECPERHDPGCTCRGHAQARVTVEVG